MMHRHSWWVLWGLAYQRTGDEAYAKAFVAQLKHWVFENPLPKIKSEHNSAWRLMEVGLRARNSWIPAFKLFFDSPNFDESTKFLMLRSLFDHGHMLSTFFTNRNHLVRESNGLLALGLCFYEFVDASTWIASAAARLDKELKLQINEDGSQIEMSVGYQWLSVDEFGVTAKLLRETEQSVEIADLNETLGKMIEHLAIVLVLMVVFHSLMTVLSCGMLSVWRPSGAILDVGRSSLLGREVNPERYPILRRGHYRMLAFT